MSFKVRAAFGVIAAILFSVGIIVLPTFVPGYSQVRQTVSEIGEVGSPVQIPFAILLCLTAICVLIFGSAIRDLQKANRHSQITFVLIVAMAVCAAGVGIFAYPHPLHNVFGTAELIGYQAPLALWLSLRRDRANVLLARISLMGAVLVWIAIIANLVVFDRGGDIWAHMKPVYGLVQRSLFGAWFAWSAAVGIALQSRVVLTTSKLPPIPFS
jgi:hypothetical membrane protein